MPRWLSIQFHHPTYPLRLRYRPDSVKCYCSKTNPSNTPYPFVVDTANVTPLYPYRDLAGSYGR